MSESKKNWFMRHKFLTTVIALILIVAFTPSLMGVQSSKGPKTANISPTSTNSVPTQINTAPKSVDPIPTQIDKVISSLGFFTIITDAKGKTLEGNEAGIAPYDVLVFTDSQFKDDCFGAKNALFESMKALYTTPSIKQTLARVQFTAPYQLKASLGSIDGLAMKDDLWESNGPSNTWKVFQQVSPIENESKALNSRTYGVKINPSCS